MLSVGEMSSVIPLLKEITTEFSAPSASAVSFALSSYWLFAAILSDSSRSSFTEWAYSSIWGYYPAR